MLTNTRRLWARGSRDMMERRWFLYGRSPPVWKGPPPCPLVICKRKYHLLNPEPSSRAPKGKWEKEEGQASIRRRFFRFTKIWNDSLPCQGCRSVPSSVHTLDVYCAIINQRARGGHRSMEAGSKVNVRLLQNSLPFLLLFLPSVPISNLYFLHNIIYIPFK